MSVIKRILLFIGALIVLQIAASVIGGAIIGGMVGAQHASDQAAIPSLALRAGMTFGIRYRPIIFALAFIVSALLAFGTRFLTLLFSVPIAILGFIGLQRVSAIQEARLNAMPLPAPPTSVAPATPTPIPSRIGKRATLLSPVIVKVAYGQTTLPKGTVVTILSESETSATVKASDGSTFSVPLTQLKP